MWVLGYFIIGRLGLALGYRMTDDVPVDSEFLQWTVHR